MLVNDKKIIISKGSSRKSLNWQKLELKYSDFIKEFEKPTRTNETIAEFLKYPKTKQDELKDVGGFVGGELVGNRRKASNVKSRDLVTLDFDNIPSGETNKIISQVMLLGCGYMIYSTRKHIEYKPRLRIIIPLSRSVTVDEYEPIARYVANKIGISYADPTTFEASRLMYYPSCSSDSSYIFTYEDKPFLSADGVLGTYADWRDISSWPQVPGVDVRERRELTKQEDPTIKKGLIGAFCRTYDIYTAMDKFIPEAYDGCEESDRFTYAGGSTIGGAVVYQNGLFLYSHHATDPCGGQLVNAWDLVRLHKFSHLDETAKEDTPQATMPSYTAMKNLAKQDKAVVTLLNNERVDEAQDYFTALDCGVNNTNNGGGNSTTDTPKTEPTDNNWMEQLTKDGNGKNEKTIANIVLILTYDPKYKGKIFVDEFANKGMVECPLPWDNSDETRIWNDYDDAQLTLRLEKEYGITGKDKIDCAIKVVGFNNRRNEVKKLIDSFVWDGVERIPTLLSDYLGAEQSVYTEDVMKKSLAAAVARVMSNKGVKYDTMVIFTGKQGIGKSTFLSKLGMDWFSDSLYNFEGKEAAELIQGTLINEVGELSAMNKSEVEAIKQFLSKTHDIYREAYGKRTNKYPRRCVFFGSTNSDAFLKDVTGNRRFWPVKVGVHPAKKSIFDDLDKEEIAQIWAEAYVYFMLGEDLYLSGESEKISLDMQDDCMEVDPWESEIAAYLDMQIPANWYSMSISEQKMFYNGAFKSDATLVDRDRVCAKEIWQICMNGDIRNFNRRESNRIIGVLQKIKGWNKHESTMKFGQHGTQKGFYRSKIIELKQVN